MPYTCCVPRCKGNYKTGPSVRVFSFPSKEKHPELYRKWLHAIKRDSFTPNKNTKVCERHFSKNDFRINSEVFDEKSGRMLTVPLLVPRLLPEAVPTQFPDLPSYLSAVPGSSRECPERKMMRRESAAINQAIAECLKEQEEYENSRSFSSLIELKSKLSFFNNREWKLIEESDSVTFYKVVLAPCPRICTSVTVDSNLKLKVYFQGTQIFKIGDLAVPATVTNVNSLDSLLDKLNSCDCSASECDTTNLINIAVDILKTVEHENISFVIEQLRLIGTANINARRYSAEVLIFASLFFSLAPHAYRFVRQSGKIILPHESTIHSLNLKYNVSPLNELGNDHFLSYSKKIFGFLNENDKIVNLLIDEIYMKKCWDYKGGAIVGGSHNSSQSASSAHVFMISSVRSKFKDVVHILPVSTITADVLHSYLKVVIIGLENIGYKIISVISDNNKINSKAMSFFATPAQKQIVYPHPSDSRRPLFFVLDTVHLLKCVRNCWLRQKNEGQSMFYPKFMRIDNNTDSSEVQTASLCTLKKLHCAEVNSLAKFGYSLTFKALAPSNLERQNVKLALQIFNEHIVHGLMEMGSNHNFINYEGTASYIKTICTWWEIVNVKSPFTGTRLRNEYQTPLTNDPSDVKFVYLCKFMDWLDAWEKMECSSGKLSRETHSALRHSTYALMEIASYCINELDFQYILPGKFQTDDLESRFGLYRSLAGSQYYISLRQLYECETKLRLQTHLKMNLSSKKYGDIPLDIMPSLASENEIESNHNINVQVSSADFEDTRECLPVLVYIAGYCAFSVVKRLKCDLCKNTLLLEKELPANNRFSLIHKMDRGALAYPQESVVTLVVTNYIVIKKLCCEMETEFLKLKNQRAVAAALTMDNLPFLEEDQCFNGHETEKVTKMIVWCSTNCFLNNYCKKQNDIQREKGAMKRKLQTLSR